MKFLLQYLTYIYEREKKDTEYHRTITVVILLKEKEKRHFKKCYRQKKNDMRMMCLYKKKVPFSKLQSYVCMNF